MIPQLVFLHVNIYIAVQNQIAQVTNIKDGLTESLWGLDPEYKGVQPEDDTDYEYISMIDPTNRILKGWINDDNENGLLFGVCFHPLNISFAISREIEKDIGVIKQGERKDMALGEVQAKGSIPAKYIQGIILPNAFVITDEAQSLVMKKVIEILNRNNWKLPIFDYAGNILYSPELKQNPLNEHTDEEAHDEHQ